MATRTKGKEQCFCKGENCSYKKIKLQDNYYCRIYKCGQTLRVDFKDNFIKYFNQSDNGSGYKTIIHGGRKSQKRCYVHRLVASCFLGEIDGMDINHIDTIKSNNKVENLEICTRKENYWHARKNNLHHKRTIDYSFYEFIILLYLDGAKNIDEIVRLIGYNRKSIVSILNKKSYPDYLIRFKKDYIDLDWNYESIYGYNH
jgi:hypothetical protein